MDARFETKKSLGQHFLTTPTVPNWMCDAAAIAEGDIVLEIGPGTGALTLTLLDRGATVIAIEADSRAIEVLEERFNEAVRAKKLIIYHKDARNLDLAEIKELTDHAFKVVANIPYYLSGMLFRLILEGTKQPTLLVYLVQKEVAKRITTELKRGEKESLLSLSVKVYGNPNYVKTVSRGHFSPAPKVDSAIIRVGDIQRKNLEKLDSKLFFEILHLGFGQKRKQLLGNLTARYSRDILTHTFSTLSLPLSTRAEDIPLEMWLTLVEKLQTIE